MQFTEFVYVPYTEGKMSEVMTMGIFCTRMLDFLMLCHEYTQLHTWYHSWCWHHGDSFKMRNS